MYKGIVDMAELKILNNRSGMIFNLIKKNHMAVMIREGQDASQTFTDASTFIDKEQACGLCVCCEVALGKISVDVSPLLIWQIVKAIRPHSNFNS